MSFWGILTKTCIAVSMHFVLPQQIVELKNKLCIVVPSPEDIFLAAYKQNVLLLNTFLLSKRLQNSGHMNVTRLDSSVAYQG